MLYITGDTHGNCLRFDPYNHSWTKDDVLIVCGDFGFIYYNDERDSKKIEFLKSLDCTIAFIDGNHENFDVLESYSKEFWHGGIVHRISDNIVHLLRGYVFQIEGKKIFAFGGGYSNDREFRTKGTSFWEREMPTEEEYLRGLISLEAEENEVDVILSHTAPRSIAELLGQNDNPEIQLQEYLENILRKVKFEKWFFGHYHKDEQITEKLYAIYKDEYLIGGANVWKSVR